jgi:Putative adhesin
MSAQNWTVAEPRKLTFEGPVTHLQVRIAGGTVNVVGVEEPSARLEISEIDGPPLIVTEDDGVVTVAYEDVPWKGLLGWLDPKGWRRHAVVSLAVPAGTRVEVGVVSAEAVVSGISGRTTVRGVNGDATLVGLSGAVDAGTVAGSVLAQALSGDLKVNTVSGDLTVIEGTGSQVRAESVSGSMVLDLDPSADTDVRLATVSGEIAIRIPDPGDAQVDASTASGAVSCAFDELRVSGQWGAKRITGRIGTGDAQLRATTVSGAIALLRRPPLEPAEAGGAFRKDR